MCIGWPQCGFRGLITVGLTDGSSANGPDPREEELKAEIEQEKAR